MVSIKTLCERNLGDRELMSCVLLAKLCGSLQFRMKVFHPLEKKIIL